MGGVVAAGHPLTAEAGARVLRDGGNAVDAAVAAVLMSFVTESPLTGPGAGGFMVVHTAAGEDHLLDFFVAAPGRGLDGAEPAALRPIELRFSEEAVQTFNVGPSSVGAYGTTVGLAQALRRFGTTRLGDLTPFAVQIAREGHEVTPMEGSFIEILWPILTSTPEAAAVYSPDGSRPGPGDMLRLPQLGDLLERLGAEGPGFLYVGDVAEAVCDWVLERGGLLTLEDLRSYQVVEREPARAQYRGREMLTNPPPSSGGILIAYSLGLLERMPGPADVRRVVEVMDEAQRVRTDEFLAGLQTEGYLERFLAKEALEKAASRLGSTTHIAVLDDDGGCASVTCSNGSSSGVMVPGTGMHLNNMLGEEDLNPGGFHRHPVGGRIPSMMAPTVVLREGEAEIALGSAGSNRIRSAILQTILAVIDDGLPAEEAVARPRVHWEGRAVEAEPGIDEQALAALEADGREVIRFGEKSLYFGGVQAVARDLETGELTGGGDPRRGGAAVVVR
jgi:gamma-glutamyltranspeptidase / glutathione hydrolase